MMLPQVKRDRCTDQLQRLLVVASMIGPLLVGCVGPLGDDAAQSTTTTDPEASTEPLPTLAIVTPTPFNPVDVEPTEEEQDAGPVEVPDTYVVQEGDSLYAIAARFEVAIADLVSVNGLSDPNDIQVGQELQIPQPE